MNPPWFLSLMLAVWGVFTLFQSRVETGGFIRGYEIALCGVVGMILAVVLDKVYVDEARETSNAGELDPEESEEGPEGD